MASPPNPMMERNPAQPTVMRPILKKNWTNPESAPHSEAPAASGPSSPVSGAPGAGGAAQVYQPILKQKAPEEEPLIRTESVVAEQPEEEVTEKLVKGAPPWMISGITHVILLLILALWFLPGLLSREVAEKELEIVVDIEEDIWAEEIGMQLEIETDSQLMEKLPPSDGAFEDNPVDDPFVAPPEIPISTDPNATFVESYVSDAAPGRHLLQGRNPGGRAGLVPKYGGNKKTEDAVNLALQWLKRQQLKDGSWSLVGPYTDGVSNENQESATAMALLAFQGAGHTHRDGVHKKTVADGWKWLLKQQQANGSFFMEAGIDNHRFYTQGQCAIALCELYAMSKDAKLKSCTEKAIDYLIKSQGVEGGWRYYPNADSDVSVTGWCVMALQSARMADVEVPQEVLDRISGYLDKVAQKNGSRYPYQRNESFSRAMTAEAILCRQYLGWKQDDPRMEDALDYILANPINYNRDRDVYYWYYATQALHHKEGKWWDQWNKVMRQEVPSHQVKDGKEAGSWNPNLPSYDIQGQFAGRLYVTCLSTYMLEVYYRHLPIYASAFHQDGQPAQTPVKGEAAPEKEKSAEETDDDSDSVV